MQTPEESENLAKQFSYTLERVTTYDKYRDALHAAQEDKRNGIESVIVRSGVRYAHCMCVPVPPTTRRFKVRVKRP